MKALLQNIFLFTYLITAISLSANNVVDSLQSYLESNPQLDTHRVNALNQLGFEYWIIDPSESEKFGTQAFELSKILDFKKGKAFAERVVGVSHWARGNYDPALGHLLAANELYKELENSLGVANTQLNIGMVYADQKDYETALNYYSQSISGFEKLGKDDRIATAFTKTGMVYYDQSDYEKAYNYFDRALKIHEKNGFVYGQAEVNNRLGILFTNQGDMDRALSYLFRSLEAGERRSDQHGIAANYMQIGKVYLMKKDLRQAEIYLMRGKELAEQIDLKKTIKDIYENLKNLEIAKNNPQKALAYFEKYEEVRESLFNEEMALRIGNLQTQYATESQKQQLKIREKEIKLLEEKDRKNKIILMLSILSLLLAGIVAFRFLRNQLLNNRKALSTEKKLRQRKEVQLESEKEKTKELSKELDQRNRELTAYTVNFIRKNELIGDIRNTLSEIRKSTNQQTARQLDGLERKLKNAFHIDEDWEAFRTYFEQVHQQFFSMVKSHHPILSNNDLKLCILARLNLDSKEMATMLGISPDSVKTARYRLRKKMDIDKEETILSYLLRLEKETGL